MTTSGSQTMHFVHLKGVDSDGITILDLRETISQDTRLEAHRISFLSKLERQASKRLACSLDKDLYLKTSAVGNAGITARGRVSEIACLDFACIALSSKAIESLVGV